MAITGLDYVNLIVSSLEDVARSLSERLGLEAGEERRQNGWGTRSRTVILPGPYLEIMADEGPGIGCQGPATARGLTLLKAGGWKSFG